MAKRIKAEVFFLKVSKLIIMVIMGLALLLAIIGLIYGLFQWNQSPQPPSPAQRADPPTVAKEEFLKEYFAPSHADRAEDAPKESPSPSRSSHEPAQENPYDPIFAQLNTCVRNVNDQIKFETPEYLGFQQEQINAQLIKLATQVNSRGLPYAEDMSQFVCAIIQDPSVIERYQQEPENFLSFYFDILNYHLTEWDRLHDANERHDRQEQERVLRETHAELERVAEAKHTALIALQFGAVSLGLFMLLALYLIFSSIESNLRNINNTIRSVAGSTQEEKKTHP